MDWSQLERLFSGLASFGTRRIAILAASGVLVAGFVLVASYLASRSAYETLYVGLTPQDVSRMGVVLGEAGIPFEGSLDGTKLSVPIGQAGPARALLAEKGLPGSATAGYELFDKLGALGLTSFMQQVTRVRALEGELARTIQNLRGIKTARVHLVMPETGGLRATRQAPAASVVIKTELIGDANPAAAIRRLVASAIPEMTADQVSVISTDGTVLASGGDGSTEVPAKSVELERTVANQLQDNVRRTLAPYLGLENFEVSANVRVNLDKSQTSVTAFDPDKRVERSVRVVKEMQSAQEPSGKSTVSVEQNVPNESAGSGKSEQSKRAQDRKEETTNYEIGSKSTQTTSEGYRVETISVAIVVNKKRIAESLGKEPTPDELSKEIAQIENLARTAAGIDAKRGDQLNVTAVNFSPMAQDDQGGTWTAALVSLAATLIKSLTIIAVGLIVVWAGLRPLTRALTAQTASADAIPALGAPMTAGGDADQALAPPAMASAFGDPAPMGFDAAMPSMDMGMGMAMGLPGGNEPLRRIEQLFSADEDQSLAILKSWVRNA